MQINITLVKILVMLVIFFIVIITGNIPFRLKNFKERSTMISFATAFTGGIFMSVALLHLNYAANQKFKEYFQEEDQLQQKEHYPLSQLIMIISFSIILFLDKLLGEQEEETLSNYNSGTVGEIQSQKKKSLEQQFTIKKNTTNNSQGIYKTESDVSDNPKRFNNQKTSRFQKYMINRDDSQNVSMHQQSQDGQNEDASKMSNNINTKMKIPQWQSMKPENQANSINMFQKNSNHREVNAQNFSIIKSDFSYSQNARKSLENSFLSKRTKVLVQRQKMIMSKSEHSQSLRIGAYILQVTFGIHSLLEGVAIGITNSFKNTLLLGSVVLAHKWAEGLLHGIALKNGDVKPNQASVMVFISSCISPIGIIIGWVFSDSGNIFQAILLSVSAGTFLYSATIEVLAEEFSESKNKYWKLIFYLLGIGLISSVWFLEEH